MVVTVSVTAVILLGTSEQLHRLIQVVPQDELLTAGKFLILVGIILPLVPNQPVTAATPLTPYNVWLAVVAVCTLSYLNYLLQKYMSARNATLLPAILGALYSSTATTVILAKRQREVGVARSDLTAGIVAATAVMYLRLDIVIASLTCTWPGALARIGHIVRLGAAVAAYEWLRTRQQQRYANLSIPVINPLQISTALIFAVTFVITSTVTVWVRVTFGRTGVLAMAAVGATDIDPFVVNIAQGGVAGLSVTTLCAAVLIAASSNNIAKAICALGFGGVDLRVVRLLCCSFWRYWDLLLQPPTSCC